MNWDFPASPQTKKENFIPYTKTNEFFPIYPSSPKTTQKTPYFTPVFSFSNVVYRIRKSPKAWEENQILE